MSTIAQRRTAAKVLAYREQIIQELDAALRLVPTLTLVQVLLWLRRRQGRQGFQSEEKLALQVGRRAQRGNPKQEQLPMAKIHG